MRNSTSFSSSWRINNHRSDAVEEAFADQPIVVFQLNANDRTRSHTRHQWIKRLRNIPFRNADQLYKEVINILQKDSDTFGSQTSKTLSIYIALVENDKNQLRYVATSNDQTDLLLGKTLQRGQGIS